MNSPYQKTGYLNSDFRIFYLTGTEARDFQSHYHDFHKLLIFERGNVSYYIEGETYQLQPYDIVLVPAGEVHRPVICGGAPYHRLIVYISPAFFDRYLGQGVDLSYCFSLCSRRNSHVLRLRDFRSSRLYPQFLELICSANERKSASNADADDDADRDASRACPSVSDAAASELYRQSVLLQFLLLLTRLSQGGDISYPAASGANSQILQVLSYINQNLTEPLSIEQIADACYLNRSYLMHLFRRETGYTVLSYITEKRLFAARSLIQSGASVTDACLQSGFSGYAAFYRAYRKKFKESPKDSRT